MVVHLHYSELERTILAFKGCLKNRKNMIRYQDSLIDNTLPFGKVLIKCFHLTEDSFPSLFTQKGKMLLEN